MLSIQFIDEHGQDITLKREIPQDIENESAPAVITDSAGNDIILLTKPKFYSQGEIALIARKRKLQMELIDSNLDLFELNNRETQSEQDINQNIRTNSRKHQTNSMVD